MASGRFADVTSSYGWPRLMEPVYAGGMSRAVPRSASLTKRAGCLCSVESLTARTRANEKSDTLNARRIKRSVVSYHLAAVP